MCEKVGLSNERMDAVKLYSILYSMVAERHPQEIYCLYTTAHRVVPTLWGCLHLADDTIFSSQFDSMCRRCEERRTKMHGRGRREGDTRTCLQDETGMSPAAGEKPSGERAAQSAAPYSSRWSTSTSSNSTISYISWLPLQTFSTSLTVTRTGLSSALLAPSKSLGIH